MNEEKDRFGDFLSLVERAREDVYFAQKDRDLLDRQKHRVEDAPQSQWELHTRNCPQCGIAQQSSSLMEIAVSRCSGCGGIWVERADWQHFYQHEKDRAGRRLSMVETLTQIPVAGRAPPSHEIMTEDLSATKLDRVF